MARARISRSVRLSKLRMDVGPSLDGLVCSRESYPKGKTTGGPGRGTISSRSAGSRRLRCSTSGKEGNMNRSTLFEILCLAALILAASAPLRAADVPQETKEERDLRMGWWREARFGMFIHWGLYAIPGGEWNGNQVAGIGEWIMNNGHVPLREYEQLAKQFNPTKFN